MIILELRKIFIKQHLFSFFTVMFIIACIYQMILGYDTTNVIRNSEKYYTSFFEKYDGKITTEKTQQIKNEYRKIETDLGNTLSNKQKKQAFESFYHIYLYETDSGSGYITDTRGWETILCHDGINYFMVIVVILLGIILFSTEYENDMETMIISSCGRNRVTICKILIGIIGGVITSLLFQMISVVYLSASVGLKNGSYPLNTIEFFENSKYTITLIQALLIKFGLNVLGNILLVCVVMFLAVLIKKKEISIVLSLLYVILPVMIFSKGSAMYRIPCAAALLSGSGFIWPDMYSNDIIDNNLKMIKSFEALDKKSFAGILFVSLLVIVILLIIIFLKFSHYHFRKRFLTGIIMCLILTGCCKNTASGDVIIDGTLNGQINLSKNEYVYYIDQNENVVYREDGSNNTVAVTRNVFPLSGRITNIYLSEDKCYYLLENDRNVGISVYSVDLNSFKNELVYSSGGDNTEDFYGLADKESSDASEILENIATVKWFFVTDKYVYYQKDSVIYKCPITGRKQYVIDENVSDGEIRYSNGILYYKDAYGEQENYDEHAD